MNSILVQTTGILSFIQIGICLNPNNQSPSMLLTLKNIHYMSICIPFRGQAVKVRGGHTSTYSFTYVGSLVTHLDLGFQWIRFLEFKIVVHLEIINLESKTG